MPVACIASPNETKKRGRGRHRVGKPVDTPFLSDLLRSAAAGLGVVCPYGMKPENQAS